MKKSVLALLFIVVHILFIFVQIHKYSLLIRTSYKKQKNETKKIELKHKKEKLIHTLHTIKDKTRVQRYAQNKLNMQPIRLKQIRKLSV